MRNPYVYQIRRRSYLAELAALSDAESDAAAMEAMAAAGAAGVGFGPAGAVVEAAAKAEQQQLSKMKPAKEKAFLGLTRDEWTFGAIMLGAAYFFSR